MENKSKPNPTVEENDSNRNPKKAAFNYNPPVDDAPQKGRKATAGRDDCPTVDKSLIALVPEWHLALTAEETPIFWFYIPYPFTIPQSAAIVLWDEQQNKVDEATVSITNTPGIISVRLPKTVLEIDKRYRVDFSVNCLDRNSNTSSSQPIVKSWLKRVALDNNLINELKSATTPRERYILYAANSIWYEALTELAQLRYNQSDAQQIVEDWEELLSQPEINLPELISEPIINCCRLKEN
ncbi:DUF928 domain-containing protein [Aphanothece sacrum]|uniref:DUF928 domain-containing protein n=1 Tax=Aphanothece sacrum FPU1 TaxID=1920663 RepID=A0A401IKW1_APHSA|nr:DUF928 domain-containing protein [Aphanothece sacrum]GBF81893.1 hypothetical protein AsFPU1_3315 [Aphanothece sacrum FPU1]GBF83523.1 hypothetical protein AsFPU3_0565 [Aphanothece sacrum FPU3]